MSRITKTQERFLRQLQKKTIRNETGLFIIEGEKLIKEALAAKWPLQNLVITETFLSKHPTIHKELNFSENQVWQIEPERLQRLSGLETAPGILAVIHQPEPRPDPNARIILAIDGVSDPGNLGTMLRTADWFGVTQILISPTTVDPFNSKTIHAAMGSLFHVQIKRSQDLPAELEALQHQNYSIVVADLQTESSSLPTPPLCLVMGNEAHGISQSVRDLADRSYRIPGFGQAQSLNVAVSLGIILAKITL